MKKNYFGIAVLVLLAAYLITTAFVPDLQVIFNSLLVLAIFFATLGLSHKNMVVFFMGLGFLAIYLKDVFNFTYSSGPLFAGLVILGVILNYFIKPKYKAQYSSDSDHFFQDAEATHIDSQSQVTLKTLFSEDAYYVTSQNLERITINVKFGEQNIDLTQSQFLTAYPQIYLDVHFGEANIRIPRHWKISNQTNHPLASVSVSGFQTDAEDAVTVELLGTAAMAAVNIRY